MDIGTFTTLLIAAGAAMTTAIAFLFHTVMDLHKEQRTLSESFGNLQGKQAGIVELSDKVLQAVHDCKKNNYDKPPSLSLGCRDSVAVLVLGERGPDSLACGLSVKKFNFKILAILDRSRARLDILTDGLAIQSAGNSVGFATS